MDADLTKLTVVKLRQELSSRGLDTKGVKAVLVDRLREALEEENGQENEKTAGSTLVKEKESTWDKVASEFSSTIAVDKRPTKHITTIDLIPDSEVVVLEPSLDSSDFEEDIVQGVPTKPKNKTIVITKAPSVTPREQLKVKATGKWKTMNFPFIKKNKRSEAAEVRENLCDMSQTRKELLIDLQIKQAKEKHAQEMLNLQLQAEASRLKIQYYKSKLDISKDDE